MGPVLEIKTETKTDVRVNGKPAQYVLDRAVEIMHQILIDFSIYRQEHGIDCATPWEFSDIEMDATLFLDMVGD